MKIWSIGVLGLRISVFHTEGKGSIPLWTTFNAVFHISGALE